MHKINNLSDREVSGVSAICCIRHSIFSPMGMVDLKLGEKCVVGCRQLFC